jgi:hypothetical protein
MTLVGLDLNSTRARAVHGPAGGAPGPLALEDDHAELPLALTIDGRTAEPGRAAAGVCRKLPHLACLDFLAHLDSQRVWSAGKHRLDAAGALAIVCESLAPRFSKSQGVGLALPTYLGARQRALIERAAAKARWRVLASVAAPVAAALAAAEQLPWSGLALVGDVDGHAFTWSAVSVRDERATLLETNSHPGLDRTAWLRRLIDGVANRCVRTTRRDPRESADAEQALYDQLSDRLSEVPESSRAEFVLHTPQWFQNLLLEVDELRAWCAPLAKRAASALEEMQSLADGHGPAVAVLLTATAGRLPGLAALLEERTRPPAVLRPAEPVSDFGDGMLIDEAVAGGSIGGPVHVLEPDALARAAHELAKRVQRGELAAGHYEEVSLPAGKGSEDGGPARIHFRGRDHLLSRTVFTLGRDPACDLVFESELYPNVSARHCEIVLDRRVYFLRDRSRHGTFVNDCRVMQQTSLQPGDWIRLAPGGPLLRFLGKPGDPRTLVTA